MPDGEVAVRQDGHEHAVETPSLDGQVFINLDRGEVPLLDVPSDVDVSFYDEDEHKTDGGEVASRSEIQMRGTGLSEEVAGWSLVISALMLFGAGYLFATGADLTPLVVALGAVLLGYISGQSYWSDRT